MIDLCSVWFVDKIGYRVSMVLAHLFAAVGLVLLTVLPDCFWTLLSGFFWIAGIKNWKILALVWACVPVINGIVFLKVPIAPLLAALWLKQRMEIKEKRIIEG